ncbi:restriction endonuclease subunit S [Sunxiuqinia dokdonensis]|uniref:Type I restriction modification DNA specificity domain-containing protein n=1 Tax=Sunxiuqinia dokdonensis TaxID=1409788 RepID=A0A0L8V2H6_9BACT|nr:restriction endonuclease subunit S [Sunxiuqinia dokdonensis]KOH42680.1 hypothetical protein NC99_45160 [Sunxiuqinia dokdonensis]
MSEWRYMYLEEVGTLARGKSKHRPRWAPHLYGGEYPFIQTGQITAAEKYITTIEQTYSEEGLRQSRLWEKNTLCITIAANIAEVAILSFPACFPDSVLGFLVDEEKADLDFVFYTLTLFQNRLKSMSIGSVQDNINLGTFKNIQFPFPKLAEQKEIGRTLAILDQKITLLRQQNQVLEELAQTLFKRWFVEFEFPTENGEPYKSSGGKMVESELGEIPEGWSLSNLGELVINYSNKRIPLSSKERTNRKGIYPYFGASGIVDYIDDFIFKGTYILFSEDGENLRSRNTPIVFLVEGKFWVNNHAHILKGKESYLFYFIYLFLLSVNIDSIITGAVQPKVNKANLHSLELLLPDPEILKDFDKVIRRLFEKSSNNTNEIQTLTQLRDTLLPKLMSGELRVNKNETQDTNERTRVF